MIVNAILGLRLNQTVKSVLTLTNAELDLKPATRMVDVETYQEVTFVSAMMAMNHLQIDTTVAISMNAQNKM